MIVFFSTGGPFSRRNRAADLGAASLGRRGIDQGPVGRKPRPRPRRPARRALKVEKIESVSRDVPPSPRCRAGDVKLALRQSHPRKKKVQSIPYIYPMNSDLLYDSSINTPHTSENHTHPCALTTCYCEAHRVAAGTSRRTVAVVYEFI